MKPKQANDFDKSISLFKMKGNLPISKQQARRYQSDFFLINYARNFRLEQRKNIRKKFSGDKMTSLVCRSESMCSPCTTTRWAYYMYMFILQNILSEKSNSSKIRGRGISGRWNFIRAKSFDTHSRYEITKVRYHNHVQVHKVKEEHVIYQ